MRKIINNNLDLYKPDKKNWLGSLEYAKKMTNQTNEKLIFHCFWRVPKDFGRKQLAVLKSILVNHIDNQDNLEINLWSNVDLTNNTYFKEISDFVNLKYWNLNEEIKGTILENHFNNDAIFDDLCYLEGDLFRLLILHKYGGFYIDMDVLVLRNMCPLNHLEFLYQWGTSGFSNFEPEITMNGAIMRFNKNSPLSLDFLQKLKITQPSKNTTSWGNQLYSKINSDDLTILPGIWFNPEWGFEGTENNPFKFKEKIELFDGSYTWHWHNRWNDEIENGSKFEILETEINKKFNFIKKI